MNFPNRPRTRRPAFAQGYGGQAVLVLDSWSDGDVASISWTVVSFLSQRDFRTQPGVLTPGAIKKHPAPQGR